MLMNYSESTVQYYRNAWKKRAIEEASRNESRRIRALECAQEISDFLVKEFNAQRTVLIGSVLQRDRFRDTSDIDIVVEAIAPSEFFRAVALCQLPEFKVDLIDGATAGPLMKERAIKGMVLHDGQKQNY